MNFKQNFITAGLALSLSASAFGQDPGNGGGNGGGNGNGNGNGNGQDPVVLVPGFNDGGGQQSQVDPIARYLMIKDAYRNNNFDVRPPVDASAKVQIDQDYFLKYAMAAFDLFNANRKRVVNEQSYIVKTFKDADRANRREQDELTKEQALASKRSASRIMEAMNALHTPKSVVATGRPLNAYLDRVNQAGSFGALLTAGSSDGFKLHRPEAIRVSSGVGERSVRIPIVGKDLPFNPPAFLSLEPKLDSKLDTYQQSRKDAIAAKVKGDVIPAAQELLTALDADVMSSRKGMQVRRFHDEEYQELLAWKNFFNDERKLLGWLAVNPGREAFDGKTVVDLLTYMRRNGLTFAAADPGDEDAYVAVHQQLRDLVVKAAEEPASGQDDRLEGFIKQTDRLRERLPPPATTTPEAGPAPLGGAAPLAGK